ncbi:uncharacterized protein CFAP92 [Mixophyes fleayi]|uniref:uncharacterized protein CFAP92 n=1 Tax=Mixophyes fleayi TaxID=3061075 RepID=UPI003F4E12E7
MFQDLISGDINQAEAEDYDSGVTADTKSRSPQRTMLSQNDDVSDYGTGCSSPDTDEAQNGEERSCDKADEDSSEELQDASHTVTCTVTIAFAIPSIPKKEDDESSPAHKGKTGHKNHNKTIEAPKAQQYFHFEYLLLPEDTEPTKVDVVLFGIVAKLYMEHESRLLKPWVENDKTWLSWSYSVDLRVTKEVLLKALTHRIHLKIWDTKDRVSAKARFDRPKAFRVLQVKQGEVKQLILKQRKLFADNLPQRSFILQKNGDIVYQEDPNTQALKCARSETFPSVRFPDPALSSPAKENPVKRSEISNTNLSTANRKENLPAGQRQKSSRSHKDGKADLQKRQVDTQSSKVRKNSETEKHEKDATAHLLQRERKCLSLDISFMPLIAGDLSVTGRLQKCSDKILDCYMTLAINSPLLSEQQRQDLNPMVIRILSATSLPTTPTPISVLQEKCMPVYCRYRFQDHPFHQTHEQTHGTHVFFRDVNVVFAGTISPGKLREVLLGPPIEIEVHDRDQKIKEIVSKPSLFGMEPEDEKLSNVGLVTSKRTVHNPFTERDRLWDPYGIAKINLSELVYGATYLNVCVPIHSCERPDPTGYNSDSKNGRIVGLIGSVDGPQDSPLPVGHYLDAQSHLKIRVDLSVPLSSEAETHECPFGRIVYIFDCKNKQLLHDVIVKITEINSRTLGLDPNPVNISLDALSRVGLSDDQKDDTILNILTGIHIMDGAIHLFILEGLKQGAIKELWETVPIRPAGDEGKLEVLYNSEMAFHERLYKDLGVLVCHVHLREPLSSLLNQPLLYIRDMVPQLCFQALSRLDYICTAKKLRDIIHSNLLPSVEMIHLLSREFGVPSYLGDLLADTEDSFSKQLIITEKEDKRCHLHNTLDNFNGEYFQWKWGMSMRCKNKDYIQKNIGQVHQMSIKVIKPKVEYVEIVPVDGMAIHNYSAQTFNSTELAQKILRQKMAEKPNHRYTYSQDFQSATVSPVNIKQELQNNAAKSREEWMTPSGFLFPGFKSNIDANKHPKKPDDSRILELTKVWKENILHANTLQPTLSRDRWSWAERFIDFDLYGNPPERCSLSAPVTVHITDDILQGEQKAMLQTVDNKSDMRFHRCLPQTELISQGPHASNQQSRLQGLLKDKGAKLSLRKAGVSLKPIPALAVMQNSEINGKCTRGFIPGELKGHSLKWTDNIIPCRNMDQETIQQLRGKDFDLHSMDHLLIYKKKIKQLSKEEKNSFNFIIPNPAEDTVLPTTKMAADLRNLIQIQSHEGVLLHIQ